VQVWRSSIPTDAPESDGTFEWNETTIVIVRIESGGAAGLGFTYADPVAADLVARELAPVVASAASASPGALQSALIRHCRNLGMSGIASMAISAVDQAMWDLKARLLNVPLAWMLGPVREELPLYGSGGFTSYSVTRLRDQLATWVSEGFRWVKMKVGREPESDPDRVREAREAIGPAAGLFVDANGAYGRKQALEMAEQFAAGSGVSWLEEPVPSGDREGLREIRRRAPASMQIAAGEYGFGLHDFEDLLRCRAVDVLQLDVTRCGGITTMLQVDALAQAARVPVSLHCAPAAHLHPALAMKSVIHQEYFHDHSRIEPLVFDGVREPSKGLLSIDPERTGNGLELMDPASLEQVT
jgi:L-alanine-DL-glutamate epimerase-like enolase superfamily enzyme